MLKQLISLFAEKFLTSKKEWLFNNSFSITSHPITVLDQRTGLSPFTYTAPSNGYVRVKFQSPDGVRDALSCYAMVNEILRFETPAIDGWSAQSYLYVNKGDNIRFYTGGFDPGITGVWFYPAS